MVELRPLQRTDIDKVLEWRNDPDNREGILGYRFPVSREMEERFYHDATSGKNQARIIYAIIDPESYFKEIMGMVYLNKINWISRNAWLGIMIGKEFWRKGFATEAIKKIEYYAVNLLNLRKICLEVAAYNHRAIGLYSKCGYAVEGQLKKQIFLNRKYYDLILMGKFL